MAETNEPIDLAKEVKDMWKHEADWYRTPEHQQHLMIEAILKLADAVETLDKAVMVVGRRMIR